MSECLIADFYTHSEPVARKRHVCCECRAPILPGEKHFSYRGKWDGQIETGRQHLLCMEACMFIRDELNDGECLGFGMLNEFLGDMHWELKERGNEKIRKLRSMIAGIRSRERKNPPSPPKGGPQ